MSSEVCPFCGKTYKRLKSHLPHCKAATSSKTPPTKRDGVAANQTTLTSQPASAPSEPTAAPTLSVTASPQLKKSKKVPMVLAAPTDTSSPSSQSSASLPPSTKKKKQKLSEQIKTANISLASSPSLPLSPTVSNPKKQSLRALIEAAKQVSNKGSQEGPRSASEDLPSDSAPFVADPRGSTTTAETKTNPDKKDSIKDNAHRAILSTKPKAASKMKTKRAAQSLLTTKDTSSSLDSRVNESRSSVRNDFWMDNEGQADDLSVNKMFLKSGNGHQARIILQDVKATLGRTNAARQSSRPSILSQIETTEDLSCKISPVLLPTENKDVESCLVTAKPLSNHLQSVKRKQASLIPLQQLELPSPVAPLLSEASKATSPLHAVSMTGGLKETGLLTTSTSLTKFSSPLPAAKVETLRADDGLKSLLEFRKQNSADKRAKDALTQQSLGQVRLRELPEWLACKTPSRPRDVMEIVQRGWQWYYKKYIDVKKGGVGGPGMLLVGYCVLSYIWSYPHIKRDRWRKYH